MQNIIIYILAGMGAGIGTGLAGLSAATVISPMLITFAGINPYEAVAIALASDVLASFFSAITYAKNGNIDIKNGIYMLIAVLLFTVFGSYIASLIDVNLLGDFSIYMTLLIGISFLLKKERKNKVDNGESVIRKRIKSIFCGVLIGFICGFIGAGGGMMMLLCLNTFLGYDLKKAVGTSVFIMGFTALTGSFSHMAIQSLTNVSAFVWCIISTLIFAVISAKYANKADTKILNKVTGSVLTFLGAGILLVKYI